VARSKERLRETQMNRGIGKWRRETKLFWAARVGMESTCG